MLLAQTEQKTSSGSKTWDYSLRLLPAKWDMCTHQGVQDNPLGCGNKGDFVPLISQIN